MVASRLVSGGGENDRHVAHYQRAMWMPNGNRACGRTATAISDDSPLCHQGAPVIERQLMIRLAIYLGDLPKL